MQTTLPKTAFSMPYAGIDHFRGEALLYGERGDFSAVFRLRNPVTQYGADPEPYTAYHNTLLNMIKILGEGHIIQKQDILSRKTFQAGQATEFLQQKYNEHFGGRRSEERRVGKEGRDRWRERQTNNKSSLDRQRVLRN